MKGLEKILGCNLLITTRLIATGGGKLEYLISNIHALIKQFSAVLDKTTTKTNISDYIFNNYIIKKRLSVLYLDNSGQLSFCHHSSIFRTAKQMMFRLHHVFSFEDLISKNIMTYKNSIINQIKLL